MVECVYFYDSYLFISEILFLLSYWQRELLLLRLVLISATLFWIFFVFQSPIVYLDVILFNLSFILINAYLSFKIILKLIPPKFSQEERRLYNDYFSKFFKAREFRKFLNYSRRKVYRVNSNIISQGNGFYCLVFVADVSGSNVNLYLKANGVKIKDLDLYSWVGLVEYIQIISKQTLSLAIKKDECGKWDIGADVEFSYQEEHTEEELDSSDEDKEDEKEAIGLKLNDQQSSKVVVYEWDLDNLDFLYNDADDGAAIKNCLHSIWLKYFSEYIYRGMERDSGKRIKTSHSHNGSRILNESTMSNDKIY